jgi:hypothetical protein
MRLLNLFKNHIVHYIFRLSLVNIRCYKIVLWKLLCLLFSSNMGRETPSHIRVFRGAVCLLLPRSMFRPQVVTLTYTSSRNDHLTVHCNRCRGRLSTLTFTRHSPHLPSSSPSLGASKLRWLPAYVFDLVVLFGEEG